MALGTVTTQRGYEWSEAPQDLIAALRLTAQPVARVDEAAVGTVELVDADVATIAATVPARPHLSYTMLADVLVPAGTTVDIATVGGTFTLTEIILIDQPQILLNIHAYVSSTSAIKIIARNSSGVDSAVLTGVVFKMARI